MQVWHNARHLALEEHVCCQNEHRNRSCCKSMFCFEFGAPNPALRQPWSYEKLEVQQF